MSEEFMAGIARKIAEGKYTQEELSAFLKELDELDDVSYIRVFNEIYAKVVRQIPGDIDPLFKAKLEARLDNLPMKAKPFAESDIPVVTLRFGRRWIRWAAAAAIILLLGAGSYFLFYNKSQKQIALTQQQRFKNDVAPGKNGAVLTLAGGQKIVLDSTAQGRISTQGNTSVLNINGQLKYDVIREKPAEILYNTLTTLRGNKYQLVLPDGSKIWLNAASSIKYPIAFVGKERQVEITGEAYFEVTRDVSKAFIVKAGGQEIRVLGTQFNVNTYTDEPTAKTTLLEGSVEVKSGSQSVIIKPGEQARESNPGDLTIVREVDLIETMAWKDGVFRFKEATIEPLMRQIARWYDVDVGYEGGEVKQHFIATIPMNATAEEVFKALELTGGVHFKIDGKKIIVMP